MLFLYLYLFLYFELVFSSSYHDELVDAFQTELSQHFYDELSVFITENEGILDLLDFPSALAVELKQKTDDVLFLKDLQKVCLNHFDTFTFPFKHRNVLAAGFVRISLLRFCASFEISFKKAVSSKVKQLALQQNQLIYPLDLDFQTFYKCNGEFITQQDIPVRWDLVFKALDDILGLSGSFLVQCYLNHLFHLFSDFVFFFKSLKLSLFPSASQNQKFHLDAVILFISQSSDCYFSARYSSIPDMRNGFVQTFSDKIEGILLKLIDDIENDQYCQLNVNNVENLRNLQLVNESENQTTATTIANNNNNNTNTTTNTAINTINSQDQTFSGPFCQLSKVEPTVILDNPSVLLNQPELSVEDLKIVTKIYSDFIEQEFKEMENDSFKEIVVAAIVETFSK